MKNILLNLISRYHGMRFSRSWRGDMRGVSNFARKRYGSKAYTTNKTMALLDKYIASRQALPIMECGNHLGNDKQSTFLPWLSTQKG